MNRPAQFRFLSAINIALLVLLFALCAWLSTHYYFESDLTRNGRHTLSAASIEILRQADKPLSVSAYAREDSELRKLIEKFIARFQRAKSDISLQFVNPDAVPDEVRSLGINVNGELVLRYDGRTEHVRTDSEQAFINALQRLLRNSERWLAFLEGHGERRPDGKANHDLGEWARQLSYRGFKYRPLNLTETGVVPDNTAVLVIASPLVALLPGELNIIERYLQAGGNLLWLLDPGDNSGMAPLAASLGVTIHNGVLIDTAGQLLGINDPTIALTTASLYPQHPITEGFDQTVFLPKVAALSAQTDKGWKSKTVLLSGNHTWLESGELDGEVQFDPEVDEKGPLTLALSLERKLQTNTDGSTGDKQQRVLVAADGDFLSNTYVGNSGNLELGMRLINWLSADDQLINIPAKTIEDASLNMSQLSLGIFSIGLLFVLPALFAGLGLLRWWQRKNL